MIKELEAWQKIKDFDSGGEFVGLDDFYEAFPPQLITLIGRFYEHWYS
jgi:hypothetical protein